MTDFEYTHNWEEFNHFRSSAVDNVFYNANERFAVIDWNDELYQYDDVDLVAVENVVYADSVGAAAAEFKRDFGPGTHLGRFYDLDFKRVAENAKVVDITTTKEFSLNTVPTGERESGGLSTASENYTYELFFDLAGTERSHTIKDAKTLDSALESLNDAAEALGVPIVVKKAVVTFV